MVSLESIPKRQLAPWRMRPANSALHSPLPGEAQVRLHKDQDRDSRLYLRFGHECVVVFLLTLWAGRDWNSPTSFRFRKNEGAINLDHFGAAGFAEADLPRPDAERVK